MNNEISTGSVAGNTAGEARAKTMAGQGIANRIVRGLLRTPLVCRAIGNRLITLYVVGRKSGRRYSIPVAYVRHEGALLIGTPFGWARNLRPGEPVDIRFKGQRRPVDVQVVTDAAGVTELYGVMAKQNRQFAKFNQIGLDASGDPDPADLQLAWASGARAIRLSLR
jgi:deazaflavin-dependent oxidoreductase (nitroreductase family)